MEFIQRYSWLQWGMAPLFHASQLLWAINLWKEKKREGDLRSFVLEGCMSVLTGSVSGRSTFSGYICGRNLALLYLPLALRLFCKLPVLQRIFSPPPLRRFWEYCAC